MESENLFNKLCLILVCVFIVGIVVGIGIGLVFGVSL